MRKRKRTWKIKVLLITVLLISVAGISYAHLTTSLRITGEVRGNSSYTQTVDPYLTFTMAIVNKWLDNGVYHYQYTFSVKNIGTSTLDNFKLQLTFNSNIQSIDVWDYSYTNTAKSLTITNNKYDLTSNQAKDVGFAVASTNGNLKITDIILTANVSTDIIVDQTQFPVIFSVSNYWGSYIYQYNVTVTNKTGNKITYWELTIELPSGTSYQSGWSADFSTNNNVLTIKSLSYNGKLNKNDSASFGLQIQTNIVNFTPTIKKILVR